ncbi:class I lanthipeptide [Fibrisoma limi]|uniref:class I lanthipeptide n=1 Tax=Fibrisoma limi TaxID=663275 RepID=UPI001788B974
MKKQIAKLSLKTDKIVSLSKTAASNVIGGRRPNSSTCEGGGSAPCCTWDDGCSRSICSSCH